MIYYLKGFLKGEQTRPAYTDYLQKIETIDRQVE